MTKRTVFLVGFVKATVACAVLFVAYVFRDPVSKNTFEQIRLGMTGDDVVEIIGRRCDGSCVKEKAKVIENSDGSFRMGSRQETCKWWHGPAGDIMVDFEKTGVVRGARFVENENSIWLKIRRLYCSDEEETLPTTYYLSEPWD